MKYLLDTNICIFLLRGNSDVARQINDVGWNNCAISELTRAEILTGSFLCSLKGRRKKDRGLESFLSDMAIIPVSGAIDYYAEEKARLIAEGKLIPDVDLLIGCTAVVGNMVMVTDNSSHLSRVRGIVLENWVKR